MKIPYDDYFSFSFFGDQENMNMLLGPAYQLDFKIYEIILPDLFNKSQDIDDQDHYGLIKEMIFSGIITNALINKDLKITSDFLNYHYQRYYEKHGDGYPFLAFLKEVLDDLTELSEKRKLTIIEWIERKKDQKNFGTLLELQPNAPVSKKIEWKGSPSLFGWLFTELIDKGYIEFEKHGTERSYQGTAKLFFNHFNVYNKKGELTTIQNLEKEFNPDPAKQTLSPYKREKFTIPNLSDLA